MYRIVTEERCRKLWGVRFRFFFSGSCAPRGVDLGEWFFFKYTPWEAETSPPRNWIYLGEARVPRLVTTIIDLDLQALSPLRSVVDSDVNFFHVGHHKQFRNVYLCIENFQKWDELWLVDVSCSLSRKSMGLCMGLRTKLFWDTPVWWYFYICYLFQC